MGPTSADALALRAAGVSLQGAQGPRAPAPELGFQSVPNPVANRSGSVPNLDANRPDFEGLFTRPDIPEGLVDHQSVKRIVEQLNEVLDVVNNKIRFRVSESSGRLQVQIIDPETNKVLKTVPPDRAQVLLDRMSELSGLVVDETR